MYNTYQNRVATARESYNQAVRNYDNSITEARLQNSSVLAEIAYQALQQQLELSLAGFQYKNQLILDQANRKTELDNIYYQRYQDVLDQINAENSLAESKRQFDLELKEEKRQFNAKYGTAQINNFANAGSAGAAGGISGVIPKIDKGNDDDADGGSGSDSGWMTRGEVGPWSDEYIKSMINRGELEEATINGVKMYRKTNSGNTIPASLITGKTQNETTGEGIYNDETYASIRAISEKMTPAQLKYLVSVGYVEEYTVNGVTKFRIVDRKSGKSRENTPQNKKSLNSISVY